MIRASSYKVSPFLLRRLEMKAPIQSSPEIDIRDLVLRHWNLEQGLLQGDAKQDGLNNYASRSGDFVSVFRLYEKISVMVVTDMGSFSNGICMDTTEVFELGTEEGVVYRTIRRMTNWVDSLIFGG